MAIDLDETEVRERLRPLVQAPPFLRAVENVTADPLFLSLFLMGVSFGEALGRSPLPLRIRERIELVLTMILRQEETHLAIVEQHNRLLATVRSGLSPQGAATLDALALVEAEDYEWAADLAVREIARAIAPYADAATARAYVDSARAAG
jgi:hypothetical protein